MASTNTNGELSQPSGLQASGMQTDSGVPFSEVSMDSLPAQQALELLVQNPVSFVRKIVDDAARMHLWNLKEEAELRGAVNVMRKAHPEFERFQSLIMQEAATLIQEDPDGVIDPWDKLLKKALESFKKKFQETVKESLPALQPAEPPFVEGSGNRVLPEQPLSFTRAQIERMSLEDFLKNEAAINQALQEKRIR